MSSAALAPQKSRWVVSHYALVCGIALAAFVVLGALLHRRLITGEADDGFFAQIRDIAMAIQFGTFDPVAEPLYAVHLVRFFIVYPWFLSWMNNLPDFVDALLAVPLLVTVLSIKFRDRHPLVNLLVILLPLALSFRTTFVIVGMANLYAYFYSDSRQAWRLYLSGLLAFLSSGVTLAWLIVVAFNSRQTGKHRTGILAAVTILTLSLAASVAQKITFFNDTTATNTNSSGLMAAIERNTILMSYGTDNTVRFLLYCLILAVVVGFLVTLGRTGKAGRPLLIFFMTAAVSFFFEGLGPIAFFLPVAWVLGGNAVMPTATGSEPLPADAG